MDGWLNGSDEMIGKPDLFNFDNSVFEIARFRIKSSLEQPVVMIAGSLGCQVGVVRRRRIGHGPLAPEF